MYFSFQDMVDFLPSLLQGAVITISVSLLAFALAIVLGLSTGIARLSRIAPLRAVAAFYIQFIRGTPLLLQLFFIYYVLPYVGIVLSPFASGTLGLTLNYGAYMAEVFRSGIQAIPKGQWEAGFSVGMSRHKLLRRIILPQAIRIIVPALGNFFVSIFKDPALVSVITMRSDVQRPVAGICHIQALRDLHHGSGDLLPDQLPDGEVGRVGGVQDRHHQAAGGDRNAGDDARAHDPRGGLLLLQGQPHQRLMCQSVRARAGQKSLRIGGDCVVAVPARHAARIEPRAQFRGTG